MTYTGMFRRRWVRGFAVGIPLMLVVDGVVWALEPHAPVEGLGVLYLLAVLPVAAVGGVVPAVVVSFVSVLTYGYFFLPPKNSLTFEDSGQWIVLGVLLTVAAAISELAARQRRGAEAIAELQKEQAALGRVARLVAEGEPPSVVFEAVSREVGQLCNAELARTERYETDGSVTGVGAWSRTGRHLAVGTRIVVEGPSIAALVRQTRGPTRLDSFVGATGPIADEANILGIRSSVGCPILVEGQIWGVIAASTTRDEPFPPGTESRIAEFTELVGTAVANAENQAELRASRARIVAAGDDARRRIERDLHDGVQQRLVSLALDLRRVESTLAPDQIELTHDMANMSANVNDIMDELLELARGIHPAILNRGGIEPALKTLARRSPIPVDVDIRTRARLSEPVEVATYYVVAEMLTNAAKHAQASVVRVEVEQSNGFLRILVRDDGVGGADPRGGSGLVGLMDRVEALGGTIAIDSPAGAGTLVTAELPLIA